MKLGIWQQLAIGSGFSALRALLIGGKGTPEQKDLLNQLVSLGEQFMATFNK